MIRLVSQLGYLRKYIFLSLAFFIAHYFVICQNIDSLKVVLKNAKHDTTRCNILNAMIEAEHDDKIWPIYNEQLRVIAEKNIVNDGPLKKVYLKYFSAALNNIGFHVQNQGEITKALEYYFKSLKIQEEIGDKKGTANSLINIGVIFKGRGDILKALDCYHKSLKIYEEMGEKDGIANSLNSIGLIYKFQGDITKALEYYHRSLKIQEEIGDKKGIGFSLNNIGVIYDTQGDVPKALEYIQKSLKIREEIGDKRGMAMSLNNIGVIYQHDRKTEKALEYYLKSLKIREETGDIPGIANSLNNLGIIYNQQGNHNKAMEYYMKALKFRKEMGDEGGVATLLNHIALLLLKKGYDGEALGYAHKSMETAKKIGFPEDIKRSAKTLKEIYKKQNKYKEAFEMYELEIKMRDSINNQETQKAAVKKQMQYTYEKKELETKAEQSKKDAVAKAELIQKENERNYFIAGFVLVAFLALFILRGYKQKQKANAIILEQKHLVDEKQKEILDSIRYAKRIQTALLPNEKYIDKNLKQLNNS